MKKFTKFYENEYIVESLNTPAEFDMTDQTILPRQIYATFTIDDSNYGMSLVESSYSKVYILELYRILNVNKKLWSFKKTSHIRQALSTVIKFIEASAPFLQGKLDGIQIVLPKKANSERLQTLLEKIIKKSYIKKFKSVKFTRKTTQVKPFLFMVRRGINPDSLFSSVKFQKHFDFSEKKSDVNFETKVAQSLNSLEPKFKQRNQVSVEKHKTLGFKSLPIDMTIDDDIYSLVQDSKEKDTSVSESLAPSSEYELKYIS